jgi:hypothetical protein
MSRAPDSVMELTRYTERSPITATLHRADEHHAVSQDEAPRYCATCGPLAGLRLGSLLAQNSRDQPMAESSSRSVAELKQKMSRIKDLLAKKIAHREQLNSDFISESARAMVDAMQHAGRPQQTHAGLRAH